MQDNFFIASRIKHLREIHNLSVSQLSDIFGKSRTTFSQIELGKMKLPQDFLIEIADFFSVSLDWLTGRSNKPYSLDVTQKLENEHFQLYRNVSLSQNRNLIYFKAAIILYFSIDYFSYCEEYTLEERADVIYALNFLKYAADLLDKEGYDSQEIPLQSVLYEKSKMSDNEKESIIDKLTDLVYGTRSSKRAGSAFAKLCYQCIDILRKTDMVLSHKRFNKHLREYNENNPSTD